MKFIEKRIAISVKDVYATPELCDSPNIYVFSKESDSHGLDPWRCVDAIDKDVDGDSYDLWFSSPNPKTVNGDFMLYIPAKDVTRFKLEGLVA